MSYFSFLFFCLQSSSTLLFSLSLSPVVLPFRPPLFTPLRDGVKKGFNLHPLSTVVHRVPYQRSETSPAFPWLSNYFFIPCDSEDSATMSDADQEWKPSGRPTSFVSLYLYSYSPPPPSPTYHSSCYTLFKIYLDFTDTLIRTMAQAFSASLDSAFSLDSDVTQLSQTVDQKYVCWFGSGRVGVAIELGRLSRLTGWVFLVYRKQQMMIQSRELEALQKKIREAEDRLKARETNPSEGSDQKNGASDARPAGKTSLCFVFMLHGQERTYLTVCSYRSPFWISRSRCPVVRPQ